MQVSGRAKRTHARHAVHAARDRRRSVVAPSAQRSAGLCRRPATRAPRTEVERHLRAPRPPAPAAAAASAPPRSRPWWMTQGLRPISPSSTAVLRSARSTRWLVRSADSPRPRCSASDRRSACQTRMRSARAVPRSEHSCRGPPGVGGHGVDGPCSGARGRRPRGARWLLDDQGRRVARRGCHSPACQSTGRPQLPRSGRCSRVSKRAPMNGCRVYSIAWWGPAS